MGRTFIVASSQYLSVPSAVVSSAPFTISVWFYRTEEAASRFLFDIGVNGSANNRWSLETTGNGEGYNKVRFTSRDTTSATVVTDQDWSLNTWHHACVIEAASDDRSVYLDAQSPDTDTGSRSPSGVNETYIALRHAGVGFYEGYLADAALWSAALTDDEVALLAKGISPLLIRQDARVAYWPLLDNDNEWDRRYDMTPTNGPGWAGHPPQVFHRDKQLWKPARMNNTRQIWAMS